MDKMFRARLVGRTSELERLKSAMRAAAGGTPRVVLMGGEAGIGKTSLLEEFSRSASHMGARVLLGHCLELTGGGLPYGPVVEAGRTLGRILDKEVSRRLLAPAAAELARLLQLADDGLRAGQGPAPAFAQTRLFDYLLRILSELCRESPVLLAAEDLHLADRSTLDLLSFLIRNVHDEPVMILVTYRSDEVHLRQAVREFLADQGRDRRARRIELVGLGREELAIQLGDLLGALPTDELVERTLARSGGNPFFAEELVACGIGERGAQLPETLSEIIVTRVARLSEDAQEVLRVIAAIDRLVSHHLVAAVADLPAPAVRPALREAVASRLLVIDPSTQLYGFRHALVRDAIYGDQQPADLAWLHGAIARALENDPSVAGDQMVTPAVELAHHWAAAGDRPRALVASVQAARSAAAIFAFTEAHRQYERALKLWSKVPGAAERVRRTHDQLLEEAANVALWGDGAKRALELVEEALAEVDSVRQPARVGALLECKGRLLWRSGDNPRSLAANAEAVRLLAGESASPVRARALAGYGQTLLVADRYIECRATCQEAVAMARAVGARREEGHARNTLGVARAMTGDLDTGIADLQEARRIAEEVNSFEDLYRADGNLAFVLEKAGRVEKAVEVALRGLELARRVPEAETAGAGLLVNAVDQLLLLGRWREATRLLAATPELKDTPRFGPYLHRAQAELDTAAGRFDLAEARLKAHLAKHLAPAATGASQLTDPQFHGGLHAWLAELAIWRDDRQGSRTAIQEGLELVARSEDSRLALQLCALGLRANADEAARARSAGEHAALEAIRSSAAELLDRARRLAQRPDDRSPVVPEMTWAALLCEAEHARLEGRSSVERWEAVVAASDGLHHPYRAAYARWREAEARLDQGGVKEALSVLRQAHGTARHLGAEPLRERIEALARHHHLELGRPAAEART
jgi:tetratricopeptide (TPR) repeat protein